MARTLGTSGNLMELSKARSGLMDINKLRLTDEELAHI
jgi:hypothetical protein